MGFIPTPASNATSILLYTNLVHRKICEQTKYVVKHQWIIRKENTIKISKKCKKKPEALMSRYEKKSIHFMLFRASL